jgi:hypothetical protein
LIDKLRNGGLIEAVQRVVSTFLQTGIALLLVGGLTDAKIWQAAAVAGGLAALKLTAELLAASDKRHDVS